MLFIESLQSPAGEKLINVPAEYAVLLDLGFSSADAIAKIKEAEAEAAWKDIRRQRAALISSTDYVLLSDSPFSEEKQDEFKVYRQALRDLPQTYSDPAAVVWPEKPDM